MSHLDIKIKERMDALQRSMESNAHLDDPTAVLDIIDSVSKFWPRLDEEDKDYIQCAKFAIDNEREWNI